MVCSLHVCACICLIFAYTCMRIIRACSIDEDELLFDLYCEGFNIKLWYVILTSVNHEITKRVSFWFVSWMYGYSWRMATARSTVVISLFALIVLPANILNFVSASECINVTQSCEILSTNGTNIFNKTVFASEDKIQIINSTVNAIEEITSHTKCLSAIRSLMCVSAIHACNNSNNDSSSLISTTQQACTGAQQNCKEVVVRTYAGSFCPQIESYPNSSVCLNIIPASNGYCPDNETYKVFKC